MEETTKKIIDVFPVGKGKRILLWLCDMVIVFFLAYMLNNLAIVPLSNVATGFNAVSEDGTKAIQERNKLLSNTKLIFFANPSEGAHDINEGLGTTYKLMMKDYVANKGDYSHDVFHTYYLELNTSENYYELFKSYDEGLNYFDIDITNKTITMKREYRDMFNALIDSSDVMSDEGNEKFNNYYNKFFLTFYSHMGKSIEKKDLVYGGMSYNAINARIDKMNNHYDLMIVVDTIISYCLSFGLLMILIPLLKKKRQSISMMMMRIYRVDLKDFKIVSRGKTAIQSFYSFIMFLPPFFLLAFPLVNFNYLFSLPALIYPSVVGLVIALFSCITLLVSGSYQASSDLLTTSIVIDSETLDDIYRSKGYII